MAGLVPAIHAAQQKPSIPSGLRRRNTLRRRNILRLIESSRRAAARNRVDGRDKPGQ